jgi:hypothetical protein
MSDGLLPMDFDWKQRTKIGQNAPNLESPHKTPLEKLVAVWLGVNPS